MPIKTEVFEAELQRVRELWADNHSPDGDPLAYFFYAGAQFGTELTEQIYRDAFGPANVSSGNLTPNKAIPATYRIEEQNPWATNYWHKSPFVSGWVVDPADATIYTELERTEMLNKTLRGEPNGFPESGIWVRIEAKDE